MHESLFQLSKIGSSFLVTARHVKWQSVTIRGRAEMLEAGSTSNVVG
jgi:nitroimidazol reductase NimA-like FMN-containing flavoprotein (pyridoxamine 5'-phosphate oxidase superfamily)